MVVSRTFCACCLGALLFVAVAGADGGQLQGTVGPGFTIALSDGSGAPVTHLGPGAFSLTVDDRSDQHDFHLQGPGGVDVATDVEGVGKKTFVLPLIDGKYTFFCDQHPSSMRGAFTVGTVPASPPIEPPPAQTPPPVRLVLSLTAKKLAFTTPAGVPVTTAAAGQARVTVRDRSGVRGVRLSGPGVSRRTGVGFVGTVTWKVTLAAGKLVYSSFGLEPALRGGRIVVS
jgi:hypothetical protein